MKVKKTEWDDNEQDMNPKRHNCSQLQIVSSQIKNSMKWMRQSHNTTKINNSCLCCFTSSNRLQQTARFLVQLNCHICFAVYASHAVAQEG